MIPHGTGRIETAVGVQPPFSRTLTLALIPGECVIDRIEPPNAKLRRAPDAPGIAFAVDSHDMPSEHGRPFPAKGKTTQQAGGRSLSTSEHKLREFGLETSAVAEGDNCVVVVLQARCPAIRGPHCVSQRGLSHPPASSKLWNDMFCSSHSTGNAPINTG